MDIQLYVDASTTYSYVARSTFLCGNGQISSYSCKPCHVSCASCNTVAGKCDSCKLDSATTMLPDGSACKCKDGTAPSTFIFYGNCLPCSAPCATCGLAGAPSSCTSCHANASVQPSIRAVGTCVCSPGYVSQSGSCVPCVPAGCPYCIGTDASQCMSQEEGDFVTFASTNYNLPSLTESSDHRVCYGTLLPPSCSPDPIQAVTGPITGYGTGAAAPTQYQCYTLLTMQWFFVKHWFAKLFPTFVSPASASSRQLEDMRNVLYQWILMFGPAEIGTWTDVLAMVNGAAGDWANYLFWFGSTSSGLSLDRGTTAKPIPPVLLAWLLSGSNTSGITSPDVKTLFGPWTSACDDLQCSGDILAYCSQMTACFSCARNNSIC